MILPDKRDINIAVSPGACTQSRSRSRSRENAKDPEFFEDGIVVYTYSYFDSPPF